MTKILRLVDEVSFHAASRFRWSPTEFAIYFDPNRVGSPRGRFQLLHEVAHALLAHEEGARGTARWRMERDAWDVARILARRFDVAIDPVLASLQLREAQNRLKLRFRDG